jgi:hypothetical protein
LAYGVAKLGLNGKALADTQSLSVSAAPRLSGMADPADEVGAISLLASWALEVAINSIRNMDARFELTQQEYLNGIEDRAAALRGEVAPGDRAVVMDQVNWVPCTLGLEPPMGGNLWNLNEDLGSGIRRRGQSPGIFSRASNSS